MSYLNLGCGDRFHPEWVNLDSRPSAPGVRPHDLSKGVPFSDSSFDVVYLSHVLEHFSKTEGRALLHECFRVLRVAGIIRVVVPDLERITELYLQELRSLASSQKDDPSAYDWMLLELYDQTVRQTSGGEMIEFVRKADPETLNFLHARLGGELDRIQQAQDPEADSKDQAALGRNALSPLRRKLLKLLGGREAIQAYDAGRFLLSGEMHRWMYDHFSLARSLREAGFARPRRVQASESAIQHWLNFNLDTEPDGRIYKPDSLYMEATRP